MKISLVIIQKLVRDKRLRVVKKKSSFRCNLFEGNKSIIKIYNDTIKRFV